MARTWKMMVLTMSLAIGAKTFLDTEDPWHILGIRVFYALSQVACYGMLIYAYIQSRNNTEAGVLTVKEDIGFGQEGEAEEKITVAEHDMRAAKGDIQKFALTTLITIFVHWKWQFFPPLLVQAVTQPYNLLQSPLMRVTIQGEKAWGDLKRPWRDPSVDTAKQWSQWSDTITNAFGGEPTTQQRTSKKQKVKGPGSTKKNKTK